MAGASQPGRLGRRAAGLMAPERRKVWCGYLRLSVDRGGKPLGYAVQEKAILKWARERGIVVAHFFKDENLTAGDPDVERPDFEEMMRQVAEGLWGGIAVWRSDRLTRQPDEFERVIKVCKKIGAPIVFASNGQELLPNAKASDMIGARISAVISNAEYLGMIERAKAHQDEKARQGKYHGGGRRPYGFVGPIRDEEGRITNTGKVAVEHAPEEVALLQEAAEKLLKGTTYLEIIKDWSTRKPPVCGPTGAVMAPQTLREIFESPRIAGLRWLDEYDDETGEFVERKYYKAAWKQIISREDWETIAGKRTRNPKRIKAIKYLLSNIARCGRCGRPMFGSQIHAKDKDPVPTYRCNSTPPARANGSCGTLTIRALDMDAVVIEFLLARIAATPTLLDTFNHQDQEIDPAIPSAQKKLIEYKERLIEIRGERAMGELSKVEYYEMRDMLQEKVADATRFLERVAEADNVPTPVGDDWDNLEHWFNEKLSLTQRRIVIAAVFPVIEVKPATRRGRWDPNRINPIPFDSQKVTDFRDHHRV